MTQTQISGHRMALQAAFHGTAPQYAALQAAPGAVVLGRATMGPGAQLGAFSVIRADGHTVDIGANFFLGPRGTVHIAHDIYPTRIGEGVTAGAGAVIHACEVGNDCVIGAGVVILDGSIVGDGVVVVAGAVVFPRSTLEAGMRYAGAPAKPVAAVSADERADLHRAVRDAAGEVTQDVPADAPELDCFVAPTARLSGAIATGADVGIWYGCVLQAGAQRISIGAGTNVQDNSYLICDDGDIEIGPDVTIGHNVTMGSCQIARDTLIGMGAQLASGTIVETDVLVAAGAQTTPGQVLSSGHLWAGNPARPISQMDAAKRQILVDTLPMYQSYAQDFRVAQHTPLP